MGSTAPIKAPYKVIYVYPRSFQKRCSDVATRVTMTSRGNFTYLLEIPCAVGPSQRSAMVGDGRNQNVPFQSIFIRQSYFQKLKSDY